MQSVTETAPEPLTPEQIAEVDAQYQPFPSFREWSREVPRLDLWERDRNELQTVSELASKDDLGQAQEIAMRAAAFDSGAIEGLYPTDRGLTFSVATQAVAWEQQIDERSKDARSHFESQLAAFELVLDLVTDYFPKVTQAWIRRLHEEITAAQDKYAVHTPVGTQEQPLPKGKYKDHPNHVRTRDGKTHAYAPVHLTQSEMQRLLAELDRPDFVEAHPVLQASYSHYAFVAIHPFADGNGRVARALASAYTYRAASVPMLVLAHQRDAYFHALSAADAGDPGPFTDFTASAVREAIELVVETLKTTQAPQPEKVLNEFKEMLMVQGDLSLQQLDQVANEFVDAFVEIAMEQQSQLSLPDGVTVQVIPASGANQSSPPTGFRSVVKSGPRYVQLRFESSAPANARNWRIVDIFAATGSDPAATLLIQDVEEPAERLTLSLADLQPELSSAARHRVSSFIRRLLGGGLSRLFEEAEDALRRAGY